MLQIRDAVQKSQQYLVDLFPNTTETELRLEGAELSDDMKFWYITFSYLPSTVSHLKPLREYKTIKVRAEDGELFGAKNGLVSTGFM